MGNKYLRGFIAELRRAVLSRKLFETVRDVEATWAKSFFEERSRVNQDLGGDVVALASPPYRELLHSRTIGEAIPIGRGGVIVDYGCGDGSLEPVLREAGFNGTYLGYDFNEPGIEWLRRNRTREGSYFRFAGTEIAPFDLAIVSNVLVYNDDASATQIIARLFDAAKPGAQLMVLEPFPRFYWELEFSNVRLCARPAATCAALLRAQGWRLAGAVFVSLYLLGKLPIAQIAYGLRAQREA